MLEKEEISEIQNTHTVFTLTMLGTDTDFNPTLKEKVLNESIEQKKLRKEKPVDYPKGETLSIISSLIKTEKGPKKDTKDIPDLSKTKGISQYITDETEVIKGPTGMYGSETGDRIARGVSALLEAINRGQTTLNVIGHSRGGVESIIIAHQIDEIQTLIKNCDNLNELLTQIKQKQNQRWVNEGSNTPDIVDVLVQKLKDHENDSNFFTQLKNNIKNASINLFVIDPVPGDGPLKSAWTDNRFYKIPLIAKKTEIIYYENERTYGFTPIYPEATNLSEQSVIHLPMPGHHGTGSAGNDRSQGSGGVKVSLEKQKTTDVQKLLLAKLVSFLISNGTKFDEQKMKRVFLEEGRALGRKAWKKIFEKNDFSPEQFAIVFRELYLKIQKNIKSYQEYNKTTYFINPKTYSSYIISPYTYRSLSKSKDGYPQPFHKTFYPNSGYVNLEHAKLMQDYFFEKLGCKAVTDNNLDEIVKQASSSLIGSIKDLMPQAVKLESSFNEKLRPLLQDENVRKDILDIYSGLINEISRRFLTTDWVSSKNQITAKEKLYSEVKMMLTQFDELITTSKQQSKEIKENSPYLTIKEFVGQLKTLSLNGIKDTVTTQYKALQNELTHINTWPDEELNFFFNELVSRILPDDKEIRSELAEIFKDSNFKSLNDKEEPLTKKIDYIYKTLKLDEKLKEEQKEQYSVKTIQDEFNKNFGLKFEDYEKLYERIKIFIADLAELSTLDPNSKSQFRDLELDLYREIDPFIHTTAKRFFTNKPLLRSEKISNETFRAQVQRVAVHNYNAEDPEKKKEIELEETKKKHLLEIGLRNIVEQSLIKTKETVTKINEELNVGKQKYTQTINDSKLLELNLESIYLIDELLPMTNRYIKHLSSSNDALIKDLKLMQSKEEIPDTAAVEQKIKLTSEKLVELNQLKNCLEDKNTAEPSTRVKNFYTQLDKSEAIIKQYRDPEWYQYVKTAVAIALTLATFIFPGLIALAVYVNTGDTERKSAFIWQSGGTNFFNTLKNMEPKNNTEKNPDNSKDKIDLNIE